jgi:hypothetical protein
MLFLNAIHNIGRIVGFTLWKYCIVKVSKENLMNFCFAFSSLIYIFYGFSNGITWLAISRFLIGMLSPNYEIMKKYFKEQNRTLDTNVYMITVTIFEKLGSIMGLLMSSYLYIYQFPNTEQFPLLTLGIVSSIMIFIVFLIHFLFIGNRVSITCTVNCCVNDNNMVNYYGEDSDDNIPAIEENEIRRNENEIFNSHKFISTIVYFSSLYNMYKYLMIIYLFWNQYTISDISKILTIIECIGFVFNFLITKIYAYLINQEKFIIIGTCVVLAGLISFFPFITELTPDQTVYQQGIIVLVAGIIEVLYNLILVLNNGILKKYRLRSTRWTIYSWTTILNNITSILAVTVITIIMIYTKGTQYNLVPFYSISSLFSPLILYVFCYGEEITHVNR